MYLQAAGVCFIATGTPHGGEGSFLLVWGLAVDSVAGVVGMLELGGGDC